MQRRSRRRFRGHSAGEPAWSFSPNPPGIPIVSSGDASRRNQHALMRVREFSGLKRLLAHDLRLTPRRRGWPRSAFS
jgi:hypothetical protein